MSIETVVGAARLAMNSDEPPSVLRERVTSKAGTTEAALGVMIRRDLKNIVMDSAAAACARSSEIGQELGKS